jgi:hypothetical protein
MTVLNTNWQNSQTFNNQFWEPVWAGSINTKVSVSTARCVSRLRSAHIDTDSSVTGTELLSKQRVHQNVSSESSKKL